ncbi:hypothetical protein SEA_PUPPER_128 [Gordonia phage Pupper]|uniref:Uncharacterized protein n=1 Tax=Gordonia phage Pupper TaxID=2571249 RepID=A0A4Y6ETH9_9CAUD|nr:hypothetical protein KHQ83_gp149 [Gordonia phage Pupper]QDF18614.1 hypothetical protein SEA_PUPPER_128 [Gordonia phage Pupper]QDF18846.1 hypothetical protein SEA_SCENTAE_127 [Gordonia phage SCentae]
MAKEASHRRDVCNYIASKGNTIRAHTADPGTTGASAIGTTPASAPTTWGAAVDGTGPDANKAVSTGSGVSLSVPPNTVVTHYSISNGSTFLRGEALTNPITVGAGGAVTVDIVPQTKYS